MSNDKPKVELFRNLATGKVWAANPGSPAYKRMRKGLALEEFERVQPGKSEKQTEK
ncbi:MAG: hypothetical protein ACRDMV_25325 [Streptosporangiales bacterium]